MIHVATALRSITANQIQHRRTGTHLHEAQALQGAFDVEAERLLVEFHHGWKVAHAKHDMIDAFDMECHGV